MSTLYEEYHKRIARTKSQERLIDCNNFTYINFFRYILPIIKSRNYKTILDVGSGAGTIDFFLGSLGFCVTGIDISKIAIEKAINSAKNLQLQRSVFFQYVEFVEKFFTKEKFDIILCSEVIEHCKNDKRFLLKVHSLLKKDGLLIISTPLITAPLYRLGLAGKFDIQVGHLRRYSKDEILTLIRQSGFVIEKDIETEGLIRNSLYTFQKFNFLVRFIKFFLVQVITKIDDIFGKFFGYSDIIILARKK